MNDRHLPQHADMRWLGEYETVRIIWKSPSSLSWNRYEMTTVKNPNQLPKYTSEYDNQSTYKD